MSKQRKSRESRDLIENVVKIFRSATVVRGGRRFSFSALVVVGDGQGRVGYGYGKANEVPAAVDKGIAEARKSMRRIALNGETIPHAVTGEFNSATVFLRPAGPGTGVIAGAPVRAVAESAGIHDLLSKSYGSRNPKNVVKATMDALASVRNKAEIERLRGVTLE